MRLCASDPLCAEHTPLMEPQTLHGAVDRVGLSFFDEA